MDRERATQPPQPPRPRPQRRRLARRKNSLTPDQTIPDSSQSGLRSSLRAFFSWLSPTSLAKPEPEKPIPSIDLECVVCHVWHEYHPHALLAYRHKPTGSYVIEGSCQAIDGGWFQIAVPLWAYDQVRTMQTNLVRRFHPDYHDGLSDYD